MNIDYHALLPVEIVAATILLVLVVDLFLPARAKAASMWVGFVGVVAALAAVLSLVGQGRRIAFGGAYVVDAFTLIFQGFFLIAALVVLLISYRYLRDGGFYQGEYYFLLLTAFLGCTLMPASRNLLMLFLALELVSAPGFLLAAFRKSDIKGNEGGLKFFIIGVLSTAVMLYGMSLIYGLTGRLELHAIAQGLAGLTGARETLADLAILFIVVGFAFKVSAVPFQFWAPDTYEGAPVPVAGFLAVASAAAGFAGLLQLMFVAFVGQATFWAPIFAVLSVLTMTLGNLVALRQRQTIRLLAILRDRAVRLHPVAVRARVGERRGQPEVVPGGCRLHLDLRGDEHRRLRGGDRRRRAQAEPAGGGLRGAREDGTLARRRDDRFHGVARRRAADRWVLGEARDLRRRDPTRWDRPVARRDHGGQLGDQRGVLLLDPAGDDLRGACRGRGPNRHAGAPRLRGGAVDGRDRRDLRAPGRAVQARRALVVGLRRLTAPSRRQAPDLSIARHARSIEGTARGRGGPVMDESSNVQRMIEQARDAMTVRRVFGDPYEKNGVTVIPAARVQGGAGGGGGEGPEGQGSGTGGGFGVNAKPAGAFVVRGDDVDWRPAIDVNRIIMGGQLIAAAALLLAVTVVRARHRS